PCGLPVVAHASTHGLTGFFLPTEAVYCEGQSFRMLYIYIHLMRCVFSVDRISLSLLKNRVTTLFHSQSHLVNVSVRLMAQQFRRTRAKQPAFILTHGYADMLYSA
ncbi:MAG: hypothetical protein IKP69_02460, partial [Oscillospiraceae bacterium]|nr:hypothetical protein [Oscillospiraceae bacterium]